VLLAYSCMAVKFSRHFIHIFLIHNGIVLKSAATFRLSEAISRTLDYFFADRNDVLCQFEFFRISGKHRERVKGLPTSRYIPRNGQFELVENLFNFSISAFNFSIVTGSNTNDSPAADIVDSFTAIIGLPLS